MPPAIPTRSPTHIYLDPNAPLGTVAINNGALYTNDFAVTLNLTTNDANQMRFSNDGVGWSSWVDYAASAPWVLTTSNGLKTVYVQFKDDVGNTSGSFTDTITLDRSAPTGSIAINNGAAVTSKPPGDTGPECRGWRQRSG